MVQDNEFSNNPASSVAEFEEAPPGWNFQCFRSMRLVATQVGERKVEVAYLRSGVEDVVDTDLESLRGRNRCCNHGAAGLN